MQSGPSGAFVVGVAGGDDGGLREQKVEMVNGSETRPIRPCGHGARQCANSRPVAPLETVQQAGAHFVRTDLSHSGVR